MILKIALGVFLGKVIYDIWKWFSERWFSYFDYDEEYENGMI